MTGQAEGRPVIRRVRSSAAPELPAAASTAVAALLEGPPQTARVLACFPSALYLGTAGGVVAVVTAKAVRLPNALVCTAALPDLAGPVAVGAGAVRVGRSTIRVGRWWDPVPRVGRPHADVVRHALGRLDALLPPWPGRGHGMGGAVADALAGGHAVLARSPDDADRAAEALVGLGPGLTPAGDDLLAGAVAGMVLFGEALDRPATAAAGRRLAAAGRRRGHRTTVLSADLLAHAAAGALVAPAAAACRAVAGHGDLAAAVGALLAVGHTSGSDLAEGLRLGVAAVLSCDRAALA